MRTKQRAVAPFLSGAYLVAERVPGWTAYPFNLPFVRGLDLDLAVPLLEQRKADPDFLGNPYDLYGGKSLRERSHGQAVALMLGSREDGGLFLFDEPEAALSPTSQTRFVEHLKKLVSLGTYQFVIATHSPILMSIPGARLLDFDRPELPVISPRETKQWQVLKKVLDDPS